MTLDELNRLPLEDFVEKVGWVFEGSPWIAQAAWESRPWASLEALHQSLVRVVQRAPREAQLALIRAHPDLGSRTRMAEASQAEQRGAGLDTLTPAEYERIQVLNRAYTERFGFPFILAVRGKGKAEVFRAMEARLESDPETEFQTALSEVYKIAYFRLADLLERA
ncbi:MAG: 2-oxo-4-hydroxy-4-carboxy-5-ureidoimidazoline decarboxylase [Meiothermus sp.]|uniref:2-oxo-4-hydroxy-4-carboxy-5-ureidoimidazoline decarboxylase n=1 Tax=Meiothermus sp. TaxID=1955249 RepID=UPI0025E7E811|nr:2-oxo-4-hydroxy-4-carboxy-5-ureidoimidazoline decarboxylase [Meiothermus sp.]MCS7059251.1 2-oxo-4-hydroxy-4-carboxy-5-ureidoimidazoline decarboxylase [Meiothermus sp.]MCS7193846.1 2-oxo-4-hydroxy-4-carboxy-5-ureidoimidazoline decarboxylase [Meiothermus sp.]MCX7739555.1 2-oxo-4-hydroxy-4-carboxy-5-ureidoimidazoline decarboxylase [Meiothermus sp.]MDW8090306.1 2-oxo-4-hydroxy-4-carboxy-5-ureidoimidazoline decarboxylase [Meiothermus sp.]MDW8481267.1 2-oxo-4-hydroxy-4-carboxy-5-ureidoimidazoline